MKILEKMKAKLTKLPSLGEGLGVGTFLIQVGVWAAVILLPMLTSWLATRSWEYAQNTVLITFGMLRSPMLLYFANFYIFDRWLFQRRRYGLFALANLLLMLLLNWEMFFIGDYAPDIPAIAWVGMYIGMFIYFLLNCAMIAAALVIRHFMRIRQIRQQLQEEKARHTEAELAWLKNQINPHFLFNTLNNISSLAAIDGEATQEAIAQLSDLLRYAMYETNKPTVPLQGEVEFMRNYIALMKLRVSSTTVVDAEFNILNPQFQVAPLLFVSLIENAFKHGVSSNQPSYIIVHLEQKEGTLSFQCRNSNHPKSDNDRSGSGIGIENTRRRLELLYHDRYTWQQGICDNGSTYFSHITINAEFPIPNSELNHP
jgi:two-component sensor histidine kinase